MFPSVIEVLALTKLEGLSRSKKKKKEKCTNELAGFTGPLMTPFDRMRYLSSPPTLALDRAAINIECKSL